MLIVPVKRLNRDVMEGYVIEGTHATTAPKGFINCTLFLKIKLHARLSWFMMDVSAIKIMTLLKKY